ncbi:single-stranded DNA-binding protein [Arthrobacter sp. MMS18-M83]|uniref:single-stranded DNA-binding protein n=1 Tax=Arthrobacter sp. MMS18-M83 TaxID=2996261 RepID=UPI003FA3D3CA
MTVIGNLTTDPELRFTPVSRGFGKTEGTPVANFTVASTPRTFDPASNEWKDSETLFLRATVWREMAENVAASLIIGGSGGNMAVCRCCHVVDMSTTCSPGREIGPPRNRGGPISRRLNRLGGGPR